MAGGGQTIKTATSTGKSETILERLVTKEDPLFVHKFLGVSVLLSFVFRLALFASGDWDMGFTSRPSFTLPTVALHLLLNLSAFEFKIPPKRIASGYRIWPEYRLHSLVFTGRSLAYLTLYWYEITTQSNDMPRLYGADFAIAMGTMALADLSSMSVQYQSGFSRELDVAAWIKFFFSSMQTLGTTFALLGMVRHHALLFYSLLVIQGNAFLMTLRRKNLASHATLIALYGISLAIGFGIAVSRMNLNTLCLFLSVGSLATVLRLGPRVVPGLTLMQNNKYLLWTAMALFIHKLRPTDSGAWPYGLHTTHVGVASIAGVASVVACCAYKCQKAAAAAVKTQQAAFVKQA